jgi:hypothetical protein
MEIFKQITGYEKYQVSNFGRVLNNNTGRILKPCINGNGYLNVNLYKEGKQKTINVHRLVGMAFIENADNKLCLDHINNIRTDNRAENLRWATHGENSKNAKLSTRNTSGIKGVHFHKKSNKWAAYIYIDGKRKHIGIYTSIEEATTARRKMALSLFGEYMHDCEK